MQKRQYARKRAGEVSLPELLDRLEMALTATPDRMSVCKALSDRDKHLGSVGEKAAARPSRSTSPRRRHQTTVETLQLFS